VLVSEVSSTKPSWRAWGGRMKKGYASGAFFA
jgi:hypothetical protein